jgi:hypothetical protein
VHARKHLAREPGDPRLLLAPGRRVESAAGSSRTHAADARAWEVRQLRSTREGPEQGSATSGGGTGGKAVGQAEPVTGHHAPDTEPGASGTSRASRGDVGRVRQAAGRRPGCMPSPRKARARCGSAARRDPRRGRPAMAVPTPISAPPARRAVPKPPKTPPCAVPNYLVSTQLLLHTDRRCRQGPDESKTQLAFRLIGGR